MKFAAYLKPLIVPIDSVEINPENMREHPEENIEGIQASLREYGQTKPLLFDPRNRKLITGNGTLIAAKREGWTHIAAASFDGTPEQAMAYLMVDNRLSDMSMFSPTQTIEFIAANPGLPGFGTMDEAIREVADEPEFHPGEGDEFLDDDPFALISVRVTKSDFELFTQLMTKVNLTDEAKAVGKILHAVDVSLL